MTEQPDTEPRQPAYDAVYAYIRGLPGDPHSYESVCRNAAIWKAVHAALDAVEAPLDAELGEAQRLARAWEEKYFEMAEKRTAAALEVEQLRKDLAAARAGDQGEALAPMFEGLTRLITTSSRDWSEYRVDAWLWAVLVGWDCEEAHTHDETCEGGSLEEIAAMHGWDEAAIAKARRYRAAVRAVAAESAEAGR